MEIPTSCIDAIQEQGCARQFPDTNAHVRLHNFYVSLCSFKHRLL